MILFRVRMPCYRQMNAWLSGEPIVSGRPRKIRGFEELSRGRESQFDALSIGPEGWEKSDIGKPLGRRGANETESIHKGQNAFALHQAEAGTGVPPVTDGLGASTCGSFLWRPARPGIVEVA